MRFVLLLGTVQRLPYLLVGLTLVYATLPPAAVLALVVLAPLSSGFFGGLSAPAWRELLAKSIPAERRASLWAIRFVIGGLLGVLAGQAVRGVLNGLPLTQAYGVLHLLVFALMLASLAVFALAREPNLTSTRAHATLGWWHHALGMRRVIAADQRLRVYLGARFLYSGLFVALPFLSLHSLSVLDASDGYLGRLLTCQMIGSVVGNLLGGYLGDRQGGRGVVLLSLSAAIAVMASAGSCSSAGSFDVLYVALGLSVGLGGVGAPTLDLEMSPFERRMSYQTVIGLTHLAGMLSAVLVASLLRQLSTSFVLLSGVATALLTGSLGLLLRLREPRHDRAREVAASA
jgi:MFS family permease